MATVIIKGKEFSIPDEEAENCVRPFVEAKTSGLKSGEPVVTRLKYWRSGNFEGRHEKEYGPLFVLGRVVVKPKECSPLYLPQVNPQLAEIKSVEVIPGLAGAYKTLCANLELFRHPEFDPK